MKNVVTKGGLTDKKRFEELWLTNITSKDHYSYCMSVTFHCFLCQPSLSLSPLDHAWCSAPLHSDEHDVAPDSGLVSPAHPGCGTAGVAIAVVLPVNDVLEQSLSSHHQIHL